MTEQRQALHALLSETAQGGLRDFAQHYGISLSALLEAIGLIMAGQLTADPPATALADVIVTRARSVDAERRARAKPR